MRRTLHSVCREPWLALFIFGYDSFEPHKEIVDCFCSSQSMFHQDFSWWTSGLNHIDDSFLHCLVFKEHRRIASAVRRSFFTGDLSILPHPWEIVKHFFEVFSSVLLPLTAEANSMIHESGRTVNTFLKKSGKSARRWIHQKHVQSK